jgi:CheY-like chemotaxis protein/anti-sigma regulatory factor (Ser/Thr protein kinase)
MTAGGRILLVDDELHILELLRTVLERAGHEVATCQDGAAALAEMDRQPPDVVVLDLHMPVLDGFQTLARIRADPRLMGTPVAILSGHDEQDDLLRGLDLGADEFLSKPMETWEVAARIGSLLKVSRLRQRVVELERQRQQALQRACAQICARMLNAACEVDAYFTLAAASPDAPVDGALVQAVGRQARRMLRLLEAMSEYSILAPSPREPLDIREVLDLAASSTDMDPGLHRCDVQVRGGLPPIEGRKFELSLAFGELIARAARAMHSGGTVDVIARAQAPGVAVEVTDRGDGMTPEEAQAAFEPFGEPVDASANRGFGLPMVRSIVEDHSGRVEVVSTPGSGTTVRVLLPAIAGAAATAGTPPAGG